MDASLGASCEEGCHLGILMWSREESRLIWIILFSFDILCLFLLINTKGQMGEGNDLLLDSTKETSEAITKAVPNSPKI